MKCSLRTLAILTPILGMAGLFFLWSRHELRPSATIQSEASSAHDLTPASADSYEAPSAEPVISKSPPGVAPATGQPTEDSLAASMHAFEDSNPGRALELARQGRALWPNGPRAPEFAAIEVKCLYRLGKPSEGRGAAEMMVNKYPTSPWAVEVEKQTGAHRYVNH